MSFIYGRLALYLVTEYDGAKRSGINIYSAALRGSPVGTGAINDVYK